MNRFGKRLLLGELVLSTALLSTAVLAMPVQAETLPRPSDRTTATPGYTGSANAAEHRLIMLGFSGCSRQGSSANAVEHCLFPTA